MATINLKRVSKTYLKQKSFFGRAFASIKAVSKIDMALDDTKIYGLVGESGSGKSTLARLLVGLEDLDQGWLIIDGKDMFPKKTKLAKQNKGKFQMVFQNPYNSLSPRFTVFEILYEGLKNQGVSPEEARDKINLLLRESALPQEILTKYPHALSGGERQRVAIIRSILLEPRLLVLDEPTSSLDVTVRRQVLDLIRKLVQERDMIVLLISHDLSVVRQLAEYVFVMKEGYFVEEGEISKIYQDPEHPYTKELLWSATYFDRK